MAFSGKSTSRKSRRGLLAKTAMLAAATAVGNGDVASASSPAGKKVRELDDREKYEIRRLSTLLQHVNHENAWSEDSRDIIESLQTQDEERHRTLLQEREVFAESEKRRIRESRRLEELNEGSVFFNDSISSSQKEKQSRRGLTRRTVRVDGSEAEDARMMKLTSDASIKDIKRTNAAAEQKVPEEYSMENELQQKERDLGSKGGKTLRQRTWTTPRGRGFITNRQPAGRSRGYYYGDVDDFIQDEYFYSESSEDESRHWVLPPDTDLDPDTIICIENGERKLVSSRHWYYPGVIDHHDDDDDDDHIYYNYNYYAVGGKSGKSMKSGKSSSGDYYVYGGGGGNGLIYLDYDHDDAIYYIDQPQTVVVGGKTGKKNKGGKRGKVLACSEVIIAQPPPPSTIPPSGNPPSGNPPSGGPPSVGPPSGPTAPTPNMSPVPTPVGFMSDMPTLDCPDGCPDCDPNSPLPCPPREMKAVCDKHNDALYPPGDAREGERVANFRDCYDMCKPSFCCIHDSLSKEYAPSCAQEYENCFLYYPCYIIWWKLHDTIGPATYLRVEQDEDFYNVDFEFLTNDFQNDQEFFQQLFGHHFDDDNAPTDDTFENEDNW